MEYSRCCKFRDLWHGGFDDQQPEFVRIFRNHSKPCRSLAGRNGEWSRDRFLGQLPAKALCPCVDFEPQIPAPATYLVLMKAEALQESGASGLFVARLRQVRSGDRIQNRPERWSEL